MTQEFGKTDEELATMPLTFRDGLFAGQVVLVSGAGRGIGKAIAFQFARLGARLALCGRDAARLDAVAGALSKLGAEVLAHPMSIRDPDAVARLFDAVGERFGTIDVLVNNAGGQFPQAAIDFSPKGWNAVIETNLNGTWYMMQQAARRWRDAGRGGRIVNIVAVTSRGMPGVAHTCGGARRRGVAVEDRRDRMGAAGHSDQLRGARRHRDRGHERLYRGGAPDASQHQPAAPVRRRSRRRRRGVLSGRPFRIVYHRRSFGRRWRQSDLGRSVDHPRPDWFNTEGR